MTQLEFVAECKRLFELNQLPCTDEQAESLYALTMRMLEVNQSMNLTAIKEEKAVILRHYVDSLMISDCIPLNSRVIDVGCGAGFPSLPLAIFRPDLSITSLDGTAKRIRYVEETAQMLGLSNVTTIAGRAEEYANQSRYREKFDVATARAVAALPVLCELCLPFVRVDGQMIAMKSQQARDEISLAKQGISLCGGGEVSLRECDLRENNDAAECRTLVLIKKVSPTPKNYPRHFSQISKKPL